MTWITRSVVALALVALGSTLFVWLTPQQSSRLLLRSTLFLTGLQSESADTPSGTVHYLDGGQGPAIVLLHGIFGRKESLIAVAKNLRFNYRVIVPDIPGFGENARLQGEEYDPKRQAQRLSELLQTIGITDYHLAGSSMGGLIAAHLATIDEGVKSLTFIGSPAGVVSPEPSEMDQRIAQGSNPLLTEDEEDIAKRYAWLAPHTPLQVRLLARGWYGGEIAQAPLNRDIWNAVTREKGTLPALLSRLDIPTTLIWCGGDRVFHPSGANVVMTSVKRGLLFEPQPCGHLPVIGRSTEMGHIIMWTLAHIDAGIWPPVKMPERQTAWFGQES